MDIRRVRPKLLGLIVSPVAFVRLAVERCKKPENRYKYINIITYRFGHFCSDFLIELACQSSASGYRRIHYSIPRVTETNAYLHRLANRHLKGSFLNEICYKLCLRISAFSCLIEKSPYEAFGSRDIYNKVGSSKPTLFNVSEEKSGKEWLINHGWKENKPLVCVLNRDALYLQSLYPNHNLNYHNHRNTPIEAYTDTIKWLVEEKDCFVIRMGRNFKSPSPVNSPYFLDYPFLNDGSDFLDFWLFANCQFYISSGSGPDVIPQSLGIPGVIINQLPMVQAHSFTPTFYLPTNIIHNANKLTFSQLMQMSSTSYNSYEHQGMRVMLNDSARVLAFTQMTWAYFFEDQETPEQVNEQTTLFRDHVLVHNRDLHSYIHKDFRISISTGSFNGLN